MNLPPRRLSLGAWLLIAQSLFFSNYGFGFRLAVVNRALRGFQQLRDVHSTLTDRAGILLTYAVNGLPPLSEKITTEKSPGFAKLR